MPDGRQQAGTGDSAPSSTRAWSSRSWGFKVADMVEAIVRIAEIRGRGCVACEAQVHVVEILRDMSLLS